MVSPGKTLLKKRDNKINVKLDKVKKSKTSKDTVKKIQANIKEDITLKKEILKTIVENPNDFKKKKVKYIMPSKYISDSILESCLVALEQLAACSKNKNVIFDDEVQIFAEINCIKIQTTKGNVKLVLPHSTAASTGEICLITPDLKKGRKIDHEPTVDHWEEVLRKANVTSVKTVLPMRQLRVEYDQFELKRRLLTQHDFIMVDTRVLSHVSHILGKMFFKKHNMLIPLRLNEKDLKKSIDVGLRTVMLRLNEGPTSSILVGHTGMSRQKLKDNLLSLVQQLLDKYPGGEANIRSIAIKLPLSLALPIYVTLRPSKTVNPPRLIKKKPKNFATVEDELSTLHDSKVRVGPDGTVRVVKKLQRKNIRDSEKSENEADETEEELYDDNESEKGE